MEGRGEQPLQTLGRSQGGGGGILVLLLPFHTKVDFPPFPTTWALRDLYAPGPIRPRRVPSAHADPWDVVEPLVDFGTPLEVSETFWKLPGTIPKKLKLFTEP